MFPSSHPHELFLAVPYEKYFGPHTFRVDGRMIVNAGERKNGGWGEWALADY
jgi:hypothetical protein